MTIKQHNAGVEAGLMKKVPRKQVRVIVRTKTIVGEEIGVMIRWQSVSSAEHAVGRDGGAAAQSTTALPMSSDTLGRAWLKLQKHWTAVISCSQALQICPPAAQCSLGPIYKTGLAHA